MVTRTLYFFTENNIRYFIANLPVPEQPLGAEAVAPLVYHQLTPCSLICSQECREVKTK